MTVTELSALAGAEAATVTATDATRAATVSIVARRVRVAGVSVVGVFVARVSIVVVTALPCVRVSRGRPVMVLTSKTNGARQPHTPRQLLTHALSREQLGSLRRPDVQQAAGTGGWSVRRTTWDTS